MSESERSPSIFTDVGEQWITELVETLRDGEYKTARKEYTTDDSWRFGNPRAGRVPQEHPEFGRVVREDTGPQYVIISTHGRDWDFTAVEGELTSDPRFTRCYSIENFGKVRIYCEAKARDVDHLFVPITGWDGVDFSWITMSEASDVTRSDGGTPRADPLKEALTQSDPNWIPHDEEVGVYNGREVLLDYGMFWYDGPWKVSESQIME